MVARLGVAVLLKDLMERLKTVLDDTVQRTQWTNRGHTIDSAGLRKLFKRTAYDRNGISHAQSYRPQSPEESLATLASELRSLFGSNLDPEYDRVGNGLFSLTGGLFTMSAPSVAQFAEMLVKPATLLGPRRVSDLVTRWVNGEPLRYRLHGVITGIDLATDELKYTDGVSLWKLPRSSNKLPLCGEPILINYLGGTVLSFESHLSPVFWKPDRQKPYDPDYPRHEQAYTTIPNLSHESFCKSLSLACNQFVTWSIVWADLVNLGELPAFSEMIKGPTIRLSDVIPTGRTVLTKKALGHAHKIHEARYAPSEPRSDLDLATEWWLKSKQASSLQEALIRLRVALEALYLTNSENSELGFRLALRGAWHLGANIEEREQLFLALKQIYGLASKAIHANSKLRETPESKNILVEAQHICRNGILKRLRESGKTPPWEALVLGGVPHTE